MKRYAGKLALILTMALAATSLTACGSSTGSGVAKYGSEEIPLGEPEFLMRYEQWMSEAYYWDIYTYLGYDNMWEATDSTGTSTYGDTVHDTAMQEVLQTRVLMDHASEYGIDGLTEEQQAKVEETVDEFLEAYPLFLNHVSSDRDEIVSYMEKNAIANLVIEAVKEAANVEVTDEECQKYGVEYVKVSIHEEEEETDEDTEEAETEAAEEEEEDQPVDMQLVTQIMKEAADGADLSDIAAEYDDASYTSTSYLVIGETSTDAAYTVSQNLEVGEVSYIEVNEDGWYIVRKLNDLDEDATETERESLIDEKETEAFNSVYTEWSADAQTFTVDETKWAEVTITDKIFEEETEEAEETEVAETEATEAETETEAE